MRLGRRPVQPPRVAWAWSARCHAVVSGLGAIDDTRQDTPLVDDLPAPGSLRAGDGAARRQLGDRGRGCGRVSHRYDAATAVAHEVGETDALRHHDGALVLPRLDYDARERLVLGRYEDHVGGAVGGHQLVVVD